jgi:hypothetical protein
MSGNWLILADGWREHLLELGNEAHEPRQVPLARGG